MARRKKAEIVVATAGTPDRIGNRNYSDRDKAFALSLVDMYGGNVNKAFEHLQQCHWTIARQTLYNWANEEEPSAFVEKLRKDATDEIVRNIDMGLEMATHRLVGLIGEAGFRDLVGLVSVFVDKGQLLKERPTSRVRNESVLAVLNQRLDLMPGGDGATDPQREQASSTKIEIRPSKWNGKSDPKGRAPDNGKTKDPDSDAGA